MRCSLLMRYDYIKKLRNAVESCVGAKIDEELANCSMDPHQPSFGQEDIMDRIVTKVCQSPEFQEISSRLQEHGSVACRQLLASFESDFGRIGGGHDRQQHPGDFSDVPSTDRDSSVNQSSCDFINSDQFQQVTESLDRSHSLQDRQKALETLCNMTSAEGEMRELSNPLQRGLLQALDDPDEQIWKTALRFVARTLSMMKIVNNLSQRLISKDVYILFVEHIISKFRGRSDTGKLKDGTDLQNPILCRLIRELTLMNEFQRMIPQFWVRLPEKFIDDVIGKTLSLLAIEDGTRLSPLNYVALIDPQALWFARWMHGHYSRRPLLLHLKQHSSIVHSAVKSCLGYSAACEGRKFSDKVKKASKEQFDIEELNYAYFLHSLHILGPLLAHSHGRAFFPVQFKETEKNVGVTSVLVSLIKIIQHSSSESLDNLAPERLISSIIKNLAGSELTCGALLCQRPLIDALLAPLSSWLDSPQDSHIPEHVLLLLTDILSAIASSTKGQHFLLHGQLETQLTISETAPAQTLGRLCVQALNSESSEGRPVLAALIFVCRQLYSHCLGLRIMLPHQLHKALSQAWTQASQEADKVPTPTPSESGVASSPREVNAAVLWEETLRDNLLNFAATPKGVQLLQQTGTLQECVGYMYQRYTHKLQVSKCEKFGYGYMLSQVASTLLGAQALLQTGYVESLITDMWSSLEIVDDTPLHRPRPWPIQPIDKTSRKVFTKLAILLSSFSSLSMLLTDEPPAKQEYGLRDRPRTISEVIDRIILIDSKNKMLSLFNYDQSHTFGLRLLSVMTSCLDSLLLLQSRYNLSQTLLSAQLMETHDGMSMVNDMVALERNYILVKLDVIGGAVEKKLPQRCHDISEDVSVKLFSTFPVPACYVPVIKVNVSIKDRELEKVVLAAPDLATLKKIYSTWLVSTNSRNNCTAIQLLLERCVALLPLPKKKSLFETHNADGKTKEFNLSGPLELGVKIAVRYGQQRGLLSSRDPEGNLAWLLQQVSSLIRPPSQKSSKRKQENLYPPLAFEGFDWLTASVFIAMQGNKDRSLNLLKQLSKLFVSAYIWPLRLQTSEVPALFSVSCHYIEMLLHQELPDVHSAFQMSGFSAALMCQQWLRQCFWGCLAWPDICHYLILCLCLGPDYQVYVCMALLRHLHQPILQHMQNDCLLTFLKEEPIRDFELGHHLDYMQTLHNRYGEIILSDMHAFYK